jgi:ribosomal protein S18 acetylase RimI-like enzyme
MSNIQIIKARTEDAQAILDYLDLIGKESDNLTFGEEGLGYTLEDEIKVIEGYAENLNSTMIIALDDKKVVSVGNLSASKRERTKHISILGISVLKDYWGQGIGKRMMNTLIEFAIQAPDTKYIHLDVRSDNTKAIRLYESVGFKKNSVVPNMMFIRGEYFDIDLMIRNVKL